MIKQTPRKKIRAKKHWRMRAKIKGTAERPRLAVFRSTKHIYAQVIDDTVGRTLVAASTLEFETEGTKTEASKQVGELIAKKALEAETGKPVITSQNAAQLNAVVTGVIEGVVDAEKKKDKAEE